jgi:pyruvate formate lyase activating enzyme
MKGLIFSVKRYCVHDGPGIRVTVFMKGCQLRCMWCHNPEGILPLQESFVNTCSIGDNKFCKSEQAGIFYSADEIIAILDRERVFMDNSGGGVTFSGGEPMLQIDFLCDVLKACKKEGYHTAIDTSGYAPTSSFKSIIPLTDLFLFDIKHLDNEKHMQATGVTNGLILENYKLLLQSGAEIALRLPVIQGFNDDPDYVERLIQFIVATKTESLKLINLLPFHTTGSSKYGRFTIPNRMEGLTPPSKQQIENIRKMMLVTGIKVKTGG